MKHKDIDIKSVLITTLFICIVFYGCKESLVTSEEEDPQYPTILYPLSEERIQHLQNEFDSLNNYEVCSKIDKYGFIGNDTYDRVYDNIPISKDSAFMLAINTLLKNSKYINVKDSVSLFSSKYDIIQVDPEGTRWKIVFGSQIYEGLELPYTWIYVWVYGNEPYAIAGHWYSDIYIPSEYKIDEEEAKQKIVGEKIIWYDMRGNPQELIITNETINDNISEAIYPIEKENSIELRVTWKIPIKFYSNDIGWHIYLDVMNGEIVKIIQEFRT